MSALSRNAISWNNNFNPTKNVESIAITPASGLITITYNTGGDGLEALTGANVITLTPSINLGTSAAPNYTALSDTINGNMDWGCASAINETATARGLLILSAGSVAPRYAPSECK